MESLRFKAINDLTTALMVLKYKARRRSRLFLVKMFSRSERRESS
jgi:hypothetical protein